MPHLKDAFGGTRAEDVREFFDALGVEESEQADRFLRIVLDRLKELPRSGETAANAIENLNDTFATGTSDHWGKLPATGQGIHRRA